MIVCPSPNAVNQSGELSSTDEAFCAPYCDDCHRTPRSRDIAYSHRPFLRPRKVVSSALGAEAMLPLSAWKRPFFEGGTKVSASRTSFTGYPTDTVQESGTYRGRRQSRQQSAHAGGFAVSREGILVLLSGVD